MGIKMKIEINKGLTEGQVNSLREFLGELLGIDFQVELENNKESIVRFKTN